MAQFFVCHAYYEINVVKVLFSNNCTIIIIGVYRPPDKSNIPQFTIKLNENLSSASQSDHVFIVGDLNINLLDPIAIENNFINNRHSYSLIPLINKPTLNANNKKVKSSMARSLPVENLLPQNLSLKPLSVAGCGRLQLGAPHWATSANYCK